jgi:hypothetical protein
VFGATMNPVVPKSGLPLPNMMPNPTSQNAIDPMQKSIRFFIMMFDVFFARVKPPSTIAKPACMKKTSMAVTSVQIVSAQYLASGTASSWFVSTLSTLPSSA